MVKPNNLSKIEQEYSEEASKTFRDNGKNM